MTLRSGDRPKVTFRTLSPIRSLTNAPRFKPRKSTRKRAIFEIERLRPTERQTVEMCRKHGGIECTMRALRQIIDQLHEVRGACARRSRARSLRVISPSAHVHMSGERSNQ